MYVSENDCITVSANGPTAVTGPRMTRTAAKTATAVSKKDFFTSGQYCANIAAASAGFDVTVRISCRRIRAFCGDRLPAGMKPAF